MDEADSPPYGPAAAPADGPSLEQLGSVFYVREVRTDDERLLYYGESLVSRRSLLEEVWPSFRQAGYDVRLARTNDGLDVLVAEPLSVGLEGVPWKNLLLFVATVTSTLFVGAYAWYYIPVSQIQENPLVALEAWPFTAAVLGVLCAHELGHYVMGRYHGVDVSLPYLIPFIFPFGTMGAIIRMRGQMPDRKALFDIGVAGPLAGLAATVLVTAIGLSLDPITIPERVFVGSTEVIQFNNPLLLDLIATFLGQPSDYSYPQTVNPVIIGGWVGMFFTVLNLLPVGQLDGGHMVRAMLGRRQETVATLVPLGLFGLAGYLYYVRDLGLQESVGLWAFWGLFSLFIAINGPAHPIDESGIGWKRQLVGVFTFALGLLCFMLVPIQLMSA
ncbi:site-2 protease family protein [Haloprofundus sp. MHR1]|uniref:site-2 protease family protein n=1 Tax=Haloprofundus sp. MHR1 TaxID=2572921 RepID=UPI0010BE9BCB|nr:site-2 protease family protein [Haloprofundus sp. MHR1]QCJ45798.1 site-2 protease family protein [Haloprofundus sp. MHR1]